jgi:catechol 2,3-dioxygenase-like lactoylglutathione lyase family enzyme
VHVEGLDHVVLWVSNLDRSLGFWRDQLGLVTVREAEYRAGDAPFVSLRVDQHTIIDLVVGERDGSGVDHVCLVVAPCNLEALATTDEFDVVRPPGRLYGARGWGWGLYVRDPDGHIVELRHYGSTARG